LHSHNNIIKNTKKELKSNATKFVGIKFDLVNNYGRQKYP
jgi:hypothetical protein